MEELINFYRTSSYYYVRRIKAQIVKETGRTAQTVRNWCNGKTAPSKTEKEVVLKILAEYIEYVKKGQ